MADYSKFQHLKVENDDGLFTVTLNRPNSLNAINPAPIEHTANLAARMQVPTAASSRGAWRVAAPV